MNITKFTAAMAVSAGMILAANGVYAEEYTFAPSNTDIIAACPLSDCPQEITPDTAQCPKCKKHVSKCDCNKKRSSKKVAQKKDSCKKEKRTCQNEIPQWEDKVAAQACAPLPDSNEKPFMMQSYAYPAAVYGTNQMIGEANAGIYIGDNSAEGIKGVPVAHEDYNNLTGAAAGCKPCLEDERIDLSSLDLSKNYEIAQIETETSKEGIRKSLVPYEISAPTGAAAPLISAFEDVPAGFWAGCDINKLTENNIIAGYPDRTFKPNLPVSRAEMATLTVKGFNLLNAPDNEPSKHFKDVPRNFWAGKMINKAVANGFMAGYNDTMFMPNKPVTRAEAFTILSKGINCPMDECKATEILNKYCDADKVPSWAKISVAKAIDAGALNDAPKPDMINPNKDASRAEIASMLENIRVSIGYSNTDKVTANDCGCTGAAAFIENEEVVQIPTLRLSFNDEINAKSANVGDMFAAETNDAITINGHTYPCGSRVRGKVLSVIRPTKNCAGSLQLAFNTIEHDGCKTELPQQVLSAQVEKIKKPNAIARLVTMPFTLTGSLLGTVGRTVGGAVVSAGNAVEHVTNSVGTGTGEIFQGEFRAAGRSYLDSVKALAKAPVDTTRTALSGTMGLFQTTGDEIAYLVDPKGAKVSSVNPKEHVTVAFAPYSK